ncbi:MAG: acyl-CoA/acyl-ACP dehydrogenase [Chloroflexi bacterium]|nr:acyl-CoA/acyl-ACP dehydrogenase [Chloroflexota bacterium]
MLEPSTQENLIRDFVRQVAKKYGRDYWLAKAREGAFTEELWGELAAGGYLGMMIPEEYGGGGLGLTEMAVLQEEMGHQGIPLLLLVVSNVMDALLIARYGSEEMKERYLPRLARGETRFCFALTEPTAGSNSFRTATQARVDGDSYVLNGQKMFITGVDQSDYLLVVVRTTPFEEVEDKRQGLSLLIVDRRAEGVSLQPLDMGVLHPETQFAVFFDDVRVPRGELIGEEGKGSKYLFDALNPERISAAAVAVGLGRFVLEKAVAYAKERVVFDAPIGSHQGLQHPLAIAKTNLELAALMTRYAAGLFDGGDKVTAAAYANMAKFAAAEAATEACDLAIEVHGGSGFSTDVDLITVWPLIRMLRTVPVSREMILNYIGEHVLGLPRSY